MVPGRVGSGLSNIVSRARLGLYPSALPWLTAFFFFSSRRRHTRYIGDWSSDVCSSDLAPVVRQLEHRGVRFRAVADECQGELSVRIVVAPQEPHVEDFGIEAQRPLQVADAKHSVQDTRSEERRVGKECRSGGGREHEKI